MLAGIGRSILFLAMVLLMAATGQAFAKNAVTGMRVGAVQIDDRTGMRLVIETKAPLKASLLLLQSPYRLVIDMPKTSWNVDKLARRGKLQVAPGSAYRFGNPKPEIGRLVIELEKPAAPVRVFALPPAGGGNRFVIDLLDRGKTAFLVASSALEKTPNIDLNDAVTDRAMVKDADWMKTVYNRAGMPELLSLPLTTFDKDYNLVAMGAESWSQSDDGLTWTFKLRDGLVWSDGPKLKASD